MTRNFSKRSLAGPENGRPDRARLGLLSLVCVMYLVVSGGAYGLEDAVHIAGARLTLLLCLVVPLTLSLPTALMAAELTALMPVEGGFYFWVKEALGPFAGFVEVYVTILYSAVDTAIYPVLFVTYLSFLIPVGVTGQIILGILMVWVAGILNLQGVRPVGNASVVLTAILLAPFVALVLAGIPRLVHWQLPAQPFPGGSFFAALGGGLTVVIWNFSGWENLSVIAAEIDEPQRNYVRAITVALPLVTLGYLLPLVVSVSGTSTAAQWRTGWFAEVGHQLGGPFLEAAIAGGGAVSAFAMFQAAMLWVSRMPFVLAGDGYLPEGLAALHSDRATPARSIIACCAGFSLLVPLGFVTLVVLDVFFYMFALALEMQALVRLRQVFPDRTGRFVIGGGKPALCATVVAPIATWLATFGFAQSRGGGMTDLIVGVALAACVWPVYAFLRRRYGGPRVVS
ncbi:MAG TPA: APC family permease [Candidatus Binataceae bacterium]|nr:APC family permease [Candidatus Binataceae bacterium]